MGLLIKMAISGNFNGWNNFSTILNNHIISSGTFGTSIYYHADILELTWNERYDQSCR